MEFLNVIDHLLNKWLKLLSALIASLNLSKMQFASEFIQESSDKFWNGEDFNVFGIIRGGLDWSNGLGESHGGIHTCIEVLTSSPICGLLREVILDRPSVQEPVLGERLGELFGLGENRGPALDRGDVIVHVLAGGESLGELVDDLANLSESGDVAARLDLGYGLLHVVDDTLAAFVASLNLGQLVVTGHSVDETGHEVWYSHGVHPVCFLEHESGKS